MVVLWLNIDGIENNHITSHDVKSDNYTTDIWSNRTMYITAMMFSGLWCSSFDMSTNMCLVLAFDTNIQCNELDSKKVNFRMITVIIYQLKMSPHHSKRKSDNIKLTHSFLYFMHSHRWLRRKTLTRWKMNVEKTWHRKTAWKIDYNPTSSIIIMIQIVHFSFILSRSHVLFDAC